MGELKFKSHVDELSNLTWVELKLSNYALSKFNMGELKFKFHMDELSNSTWMNSSSNYIWMNSIAFVV
jgi:hypothetical protein